MNCSIFYLFALVACWPGPNERMDDDTEDTPDPDTGAETQDECEPEAEVFNGLDEDCNGCVDDMPWSTYFMPDLLLVTVYDGDPEGYRFGFICADGVLAEACLDGVEACHELTTGAGTDQWVALNYVDSEDEVVPSITTMLGSESTCSYALWDSSGACNALYPDGELNPYAETDCCSLPYFTNPF